MAKHILALVGVLFLSILSSATAEGKNDTEVSNTTASPPKNSPFVTSLYEALKYEKVFDKLFDISFNPKDVAAAFYSNIRLFMMQLGAKNPRVLPARVAVAAKKAFKKKISSYDYFKAFATAKEATFESIGVFKKYDVDQVTKSFASTLAKAVKYVGGSGPKAGLRALSLGSADFFKMLGAATPHQAKSHIERFLAELLKV